MKPCTASLRCLAFYFAVFCFLLGCGGHANAGESLDALLKDYEAYGLPLPPAGSELAILPSASVSVSNGVRHQDMHLVLLVKPAAPMRKAVYWVGCEEGAQWHGIEFRPVQPQTDLLQKTVPLPPGSGRGGFSTYPDLALAVQCQALGWKELATALLERSRQKPERSSFERRKPRPRDDRTALAELAWSYYCNQFVKTRGVRQPIVKRLKEIAAGRGGLGTKAHRNLIEDLEKTLAEVKTKPGSLDAALESLLDFNQEGSWLGSGYRELHNYADWNASYKKLRDQGMSAVPLLLQHLDDFRLTRRTETKSDRSYTWHLRIADVVAQLLNGLVSEPFSFDFLEEEGRGVRLDRSQVEAWWKEAGGKKELDYLLKNIEKKSAGGRPELNASVLQALGARYPDELVRLFERRLSEGQAAHDEWFYALVRSKAPQETKTRLLLTAAKTKDEWLRVLALRELTQLAHPQAVPLLVQALDEQPKTPKVSYWTSNIGNFAQIAIMTRDDRAWEALAKTARRVDVGQRLEILNAFSRVGGWNKDSRPVRFLQGFLSDAEIRDQKSSKLFDGPGAAFTHDKIAVRDFAAEQLANLLGLKVEVDSTWTPEQWAKLREQVQAAAVKELQSTR